MIKALSVSIAALAVTVAVPALAQSDNEGAFNGIYVGGSFGGAFQPNDRGESIVFDRNRDGRFGDTLSTPTNPNAFSPGFCNGSATTPAPNGCRNDDDGIEYMGKIGADTHFGNIVVGVVAEFGKSDITDSVSAFSTTPARYTMTRDLEFNGGVRGRLGYAQKTTLFYATGGAAYGRVRNLFSTSNAINSFTPNGSHDAWGYTAGGGVEQIVFSNFSVGLEYLFTSLNDDKSQVFVGPGTAPPTNAFLVGGSGGTNFARSDLDFNFHSIRVTAAFRF